MLYASDGDEPSTLTRSYLFRAWQWNLCYTHCYIGAEVVFLCEVSAVMAELPCSPGRIHQALLYELVARVAHEHRIDDAIENGRYVIIQTGFVSKTFPCLVF